MYLIAGNFQGVIFSGREANHEILTYETSHSCNEPRMGVWFIQRAGATTKIFQRSSLVIIARARREGPGPWGRG